MCIRDRFQYLPAAACHIAQGIGGVYVLHRKAIAVKFVETDSYLNLSLIHIFSESECSDSTVLCILSAVLLQRHVCRLAQNRTALFLCRFRRHTSAKPVSYTHLWWNGLRDGQPSGILPAERSSVGYGCIRSCRVVLPCRIGSCLLYTSRCV